MTSRDVGVKCLCGGGKTKSYCTISSQIEYFICRDPLDLHHVVRMSLSYVNRNWWNKQHVHIHHIGAG